jgi:3-oxoacyl-[acyl-carrier-protein] synthase II
MNSPRDVVITGVGIISPIGLGFDAFWESVRAGRSGVTTLEPFFSAGNLPFGIGAPLRDFDGKNFVQPRKSMKVMSREIQTAYAAADLAMKHAGLTKGQIAPSRFGVVLGSEMLYGEVEELIDVYRHCYVDGQFQFDLWGKNALADIFPLWMLKYLPNMAACHIGIAHDAQGPNNTITLGEVSGLLAIVEGASYIQRGLADVVLVGGTGSRLSHAALAFRGALDVVNWNGVPQEASRPFDAQRAGLVQGEGAGMLVLETREHAQARNANLLARVAGFASRSEPAFREQRTGLGIRNAILGALKSAQCTPDQISHVNAHGISTRHDDAMEAQAIQALLGAVPVTAPKSLFGHLGAGGGIVELAASVGALLHGEVPLTLNYTTPDPLCPVNVVHGEALRATQSAALVLNHNQTGQAAAVVLTAE